MANANTPYGLRPVSMIDGSCYTGTVRRYYVPSTDATAIGIGDPVVIAGSADADGIPTVTRLATPGTDVMVGVMVGVQPLPADLSINYRKASTAMYIYCTVGPDVLYEVQEDSDGGALAATNVGQNANLVLGTVDTTTGNGKTMLDSSTANTTNSLDVQIIQLANHVDNAIGNYAKWFVKLNRCQYVNAATGI
jgi:hypothetical protein